MFHEPGVSIQRLDSIFAKKNRTSLGSIGASTLPSASYLATILCRKDEANHFSLNFVCILKGLCHGSPVHFV